MSGQAAQVTGLDELLARAAAALERGDVAAAAAALDGVADYLRREDPPVEQMVRAAWLAAAVSLERRDWVGFHEQADNAVALLRASGQDGLADELTMARNRAANRTASDDRVRADGELGLLDTLALSCGLLLDIYQDQVDGDPAWRVVDDDRAQIPELIAVIEELTGRPARLGVAVRALALDPIESTLLAVLVPLALYPALAERAAAVTGLVPGDPGIPADLLARLAFESVPARDAARARLRAGSRLHGQEVIELDGDRVRLEDGMAAFFAGDWLSPAADPAAARLDPAEPEPGSLIEAVDRIRRAVGGALAEQPSLVVVRGPRGSGRRSAVRAAAGDAGRPVLWLDGGRLADEPGPTRPLLRRCARDALLWNAILCAELEPGADGVDALLEAAGDRRLSFVAVTGAERDHELMAELRRARPALHAVELPGLDPLEQARAWRQLLEQRGVPAPPDSEIETWLCRPGLTVGDIATSVEAAVEAWDEVDVEALLEELDALVTHELDELALAHATDDAGALSASTEIEVSAAVAALSAPGVAIDPWGVQARLSGRRQGGAVLVCGTDGACAAVAARIAGELGAPLYGTDLDQLATAGDGPARLGQLFAAAGRRGAVLMVDVASDSEPALVNRLGRELDQGSAVVIVTAADSDDCPAPLRGRVDATVGASLA